MTKEALLDRATSVATYGGSGTALIAGLTANDVAAIGGLAIALVALLVNVWFKHQHLKLARDAVESGRANIVIDGDSQDG
ncbi:MAG: hypothetical protein EG825_00425 [Rhodocyclaceae bacterium]|nr:hypothetical protein [Rhodocyclaceae bacterium]